MTVPNKSPAAACLVSTGLLLASNLFSSPLCVRSRHNRNTRGLLMTVTSTGTVHTFAPRPELLKERYLQLRLQITPKESGPGNINKWS